MENNNPPQVIAQSSVVGLQERKPFNTMFSVIDPDPNSTIVTYQFRDNGQLGGQFLRAGQPLEPFVWHEIPGNLIGSIDFLGATSQITETFSLRAYDGVFWSNLATGRISSGNSSPEITTTPGRVAAQEEVAISQFFSVTDADLDQILAYYIVDRRQNTDGGFFRLDGISQTQASFLYVEADDMPRLMYRGGLTGRQTEDIAVMAYDGFSWSELASFEMTTSVKPQITATGETIFANDVRWAGAFFNVTDQDGDVPTNYIVNDYGASPTSGYWRYQGQRMPAGTWFNVPAANIDELFYVGAADGPTEETVGIMVYDGYEFSDIFNTAIRTVVPPGVSGTDRDIQARHYLNMATGGTSPVSGAQAPGEEILTFFDLDGSEVTQIGLVDRAVNAISGQFYVNGDPIPQGQWFFVTPDQLDTVEYRGGLFGPQAENIGAMAAANGAWSEVANFRFGTLENVNGPTLNLVPATARLGTVMALNALFSWSDPEGDLLETVRFFDTGTSADSGYFSINGVRQQAQTWIEIPFDDVSAVRYHFPNVGSSEVIRMQVSDGVKVSSVESAELTANPTPTIAVNDNDISLDTLESVSASSFFQQTDNGLPLTRYQIYDEFVTPGAGDGQGDRSGRVFLREPGAGNNGEQLQGGVVHTLTAEQFGRLEFQGAESDFGRSLDPILVRATNDATGWTEWHRINVNTDPVGGDSLTSGTQWVNPDGTTGTEDTVITYMFIDGDPQGAAGHYPPTPTYYVCSPAPDPDDECNEAEEGKALNQLQRETIRDILGYFETVAKLDFVEVPYTEDASNATLTFGTANLPAGVGAWAYLPNGLTTNGLSSKPGDIWFSRTAGFEPDTNTDVGLGSAFRFTAYHEIGHALGFKHPFTLPDPLPIFLDFDYNTVMSYTHDNVNNPLPFGPYPEQPSTGMLYDLVEVQRLYGAREVNRPGNDHYGNNFSGSYPHFINNNEQHQTTLYDTDGIDTLNYNNHTADETIDLREGSWSSINGVQQSLRIAYETTIENARGGSGNDRITGNETSNLLFGGAGNDTLEPLGGNDVSRGGAGNDTYVWNFGDGRDFIREESAGGVDTILAFDATGRTNAFSDDVRIFKVGDDLRIDMATDRGEGQGTIQIANMADAESRVELMAIHDHLGRQIGEQLDLLSIWDQATTTPTFFRITETEGQNGGFIGVPV